MKKKLFTFFVSVFVLISAFSGTFVIHKDKNTKLNTSKQESRDKAIDFKLKAVNGGEVKLSTLKGKVVVVNFFATWCPPCKAELPDFIKISQAMSSNKKIKFVFVDVGESAEAVKQFITSNNYNSINPLLDTKNTVSVQYSITGIPTTYIIDKAGNIELHHIGYMDKNSLKAAVNGALAE